MITSEKTDLIIKAIIEFQKEIKPIKKTEINPYYKSTYADLTSVLEAIKTPLETAELSFVQFPDEDGLTTRLMHSSGQWIQATMKLFLSKQDAQGQGSAITYARRYALTSILGLATEDDDGNKASQPVAVVVSAEKLACHICQAPANRKSGTSLKGKPYQGIFCTANREHIQWETVDKTPKKQALPVQPLPQDDWRDKEIRLEDIPF